MGIFTSQELMELKDKLKQTEKRTEDFVRIVLSCDKRARNNDVFLMLAVWELQGIEVYIPNHVITMKKIFLPSSISRARRKIQNTQGQFLPTDFRVAQARGIKEEVMREYYGREQYAELDLRPATQWRDRV